MFRKRKMIAPHFRMPNPTNPVTGDDAYLYPQKKPYVRFTLTEDMTTEDEVKDATMTDTDQWGPVPIYHCPNIKIHVHNQLTKEEDVYEFHGEIGDVGIALWDHDMEWRIVYMLGKVGTRGGCLNENHKGRGTTFEINLGTWDPAQNKWIYATGDPKIAIDWRYDVPYPIAGATGLFEARASDEHGTIWETVALDCDSPGSCGS